MTDADVMKRLGRTHSPPHQSGCCRLGTTSLQILRIKILIFISLLALPVWLLSLSLYLLFSQGLLFYYFYCSILLSTV